MLKLLCFCAVGGPLPLPTKPLSDCRAVKRSPITAGNSDFKVPVYSAHAAALQRLVITICSGFYILTPDLYIFFCFSIHPSSVYRILFFPASPSSFFASFPPSLASFLLSSKQSLFKLHSALRVLSLNTKDYFKKGV